MSFLRGLKRRTENCFMMLLDPYFFSWTNNHCVCSDPAPCVKSPIVLLQRKRTPNDQWNLLQKRKTLLSIGWWHENIAGALFVPDISLNHDPRTKQRWNPHGWRVQCLHFLWKWLKSVNWVRFVSQEGFEHFLRKELHFLPRPFLSKLMLLYPPPPMLSSSRSRHSIVVLNSYDDDPNIFQWQIWLSSESFSELRAPFSEIIIISLFGLLGFLYTWQHFPLPIGADRAFVGLVTRPINWCVIWFAFSLFSLFALMDFFSPLLADV